MSAPVTCSVDCATGEVVVRPMNADELAQWQTDQAAAAKRADQPDPPKFADQIAAAVTAGVFFAVPAVDQKAVTAAVLDALAPDGTTDPQPMTPPTAVTDVPTP